MDLLSDSINITEICVFYQTNNFFVGYQEYPATTTIYEGDIDFTCDKNEVYSIPGNCSAFIECSSGRPYVQTCAPGMHFNEKMQMCDTPCNARCDESLGE